MMYINVSTPNNLHDSTQSVQLLQQDNIQLMDPCLSIVFVYFVV